MRNDDMGMVLNDAPRMPATVRTAPHNTPTVVHISDDGRNEDYAPTGQFVISVERSDAGTLSVDVLDERGDVLRMQSFSTKAGRCLLTVDVSQFPQGRYALRVLSGTSASVTRFRRD